MIDLNRRLKSAALVVMFAALSICSTNTALAQSKVTVATNPTYVPFESRDPATGHMVGYDIDILAAVTKEAGLDYELKLINFDGIIPALLAGQVDMAITGMTITTAREKKVDFSKPYYSSGLRLLVRSGSRDIHTLDDLKGRKVGTETGTTAYNYLKSHAPEAKMVLFPASGLMYMALMNQNVDAVLFDEPSIEYFVKTKGNNRVKTVGPLYHGEFYGIAFPSGSPLRNKVNAALTRLKKNGVFTQLYEKWFNQKPPKDLMAAMQ